MKNGYLSQYFEGVMAKRLSAVEANLEKSNQHEFNGVAAMKSIFGKERQKFPTQFLFLDDENVPISEDGFLTWYDARENHPTRSEYRLYLHNTVIRRPAFVDVVMIIALQLD